MRKHSFKTRYINQRRSFEHSSHSQNTVLSKYIWDLKDSNTDFSIKWSIVTQANSYKGTLSRCNLCLTEKLCILSSEKSTLLNKRSELVTKCRHENKFSQSETGSLHTASRSQVKFYLNRRYGRSLIIAFYLSIFIYNLYFALHEFVSSTPPIVWNLFHFSLLLYL